MPYTFFLCTKALIHSNQKNLIESRITLYHILTSIYTTLLTLQLKFLKPNKEDPL